MKSRCLAFFTMIGLIAGLAVPAHSTSIQAVGSSLELNAYASIADIGGLDTTANPVTDSIVKNQGGTINPLDGTVNATASIEDSSVTTSLTVGASWTSLSSGSVIFDGSIVLDNFPEGPNGGGSYTKAGSSFWTYSFISDTDGKFSFTYDSSNTQTNNITGTTIFSSSFAGIQYYNNGSNSWLNVPRDNPNPVSFDIAANELCTVGFGWVRETIAMGGVGSLTLNTLGTFDWSIETAAPAPVPEPATMLLFGTGLVGLVGARLRKKKK